MLSVGSAAAAPAGADKAAEKPARPNILWIYVEDMNGWLSCYGDDLIETPNIDRLAKAGVRFTRAYMPAGVCSATRSGVITGTMQTTFGLHHHRSGRPTFRGKSMGPDFDAIRLPKGVKTIPELFKAAGYYTFNQGKDDYNFLYNREDLYDGGTGRMGFQGGSEWAGRKPGQPFFGQIQLRGGKSRPKKKVVDRSKVPVPPYYPDVAIVRQEIGHHYDCIAYTDQQVGRILAALEKENLLDSTIVFFFTDHGFRMLRHKQFLYEGGIRVPLVIRGIGGHDRLKPGTVRRDLVSGIDLGPTSLRLAGLPVPKYMEGRDILAADFTPREYVIAARDRCDYTIEHIRAVVSGRYKYLRNFLPDRPYMQPQYRDGREYTEVLRRMAKAGKLNSAQAAFWAKTKPAEELYDLEADPHEINNLAGDPKHAETLKRVRGILADWMKQTDDKGQYPESDAGLRAVLKRWGAKCVNPEYDRVRKKE